MARGIGGARAPAFWQGTTFGRILPTLTPLPQCLQLNQDGHETRSQCLQLSLVMVRDSEEAEEEEAEAEEEEEEEEDDRRR